MKLIGESNRYFNAEDQAPFAIRRGVAFDVDESKQKNREEIRLFVESGYMVPASYPEQVELRIDANYFLRVDGTTFTGSAGDRRTLPRKPASMLIARFAASPVDKSLWSPKKEPKISEESIIKLYDPTDAKKENWVKDWRDR